MGPKAAVEEVKTALKKMKNNKSPGPDGLPIEFFKYLDDSGLAIILDILNECWEKEILPSELELAELVTLYKKGNVENPANYRPIALLNTLYKIYASLLQIRLAEKLEAKMWKTQFGFRKKHSTAEALYISRRIQDWAETSGDKTFFVFLDWEKAFDKVDQEKLIEAMDRLNIPTKILNVLRSFYRAPKFSIRDNEGKSDFRVQQTGIRQGCPLSPYPFICLMTVMFEDIHFNQGRTLSMVE